MLSARVLKFTRAKSNIGLVFHRIYVPARISFRLQRAGRASSDQILDPTCCTTGYTVGQSRYARSVGSPGAVTGASRAFSTRDALGNATREILPKGNNRFEICIIKREKLNTRNASISITIAISIRGTSLPN
ncbi:hypothetical protein PUN28_011974 [Cardiocondyla obscurior]|uniref:Uncharacterized protein n=1 Tax=Cardiocondyla obscurior TaxID=286306 RepID=A0AAW2F9Y0_9HYME